MAKRARQGGRGLLRAATDELGLTTPKAARKRRPVRSRSKPRIPAARQFRR